MPGYAGGTSYSGCSSEARGIADHPASEFVFLHDPAESLTLQVVLDKPLVSFLQSQGMVLHHELIIRNDGWKPAADRLAAALGRKAGTVDTLVRSGKFSLWVKRPREK